MKISRSLDVSTVAAWRAWLRKNHAKAKDIWLIYHKKSSGKPRVSYNDAVDEAMCFGWIDSTAKRLDDHRSCQRFSPRRKGSPCSELNKHRAIRMIKEGRMTPAGLAALEGTLGEGAKIHRGSILHTAPHRIHAAILRELKKDELVWKNYRKFPEAYRRIRTTWIEAALDRPEVFEQRLKYFLKQTALNKRFGMYQHP